jgi:hypothetical protein
MPLIMFVSSSFNTYINLPKKKLHHFSIVPELKMQKSRNIARSISPTSLIGTQIQLKMQNSRNKVIYLGLRYVILVFPRLGGLFHIYNDVFFSDKLTHVLKEEDTKIIKGIPQIYIENRNIKQQMVTG